MTDEVDEIGPIDYLVVEYANGRPTGEALPYLLQLVDDGIIRILDVGLLAKDAEGNYISMTLEDLPGLGVTGFEVLGGLESGILSDEDIDEVAAIIEPGAAAAILVYENSWAAPFASALRRAGARVVSQGRIQVQDILAALGETVD